MKCVEESFPKHTVELLGLKFYKGVPYKTWYDAKRDMYRIEHIGSGKNLMIDAEKFDRYFNGGQLQLPEGK